MSALPDRFWSKVNKSGPVPEQRPDLGPCWVWTSATRTGYGVFRLVGNTNVSAHVLAFEAERGEVSEDLDLDHLCRNRACCNPAHLEPVSRAVNLQRGIGPAVTKERHAAKTSCPQGHAYDAANTRRGQDGKRYCRACLRERARNDRRAKAGV